MSFGFGVYDTTLVIILTQSSTHIIQENIGNHLLICSVDGIRYGSNEHKSGSEELGVRDCYAFISNHHRAVELG